MNCETVAELLEAHALGALEPAAEAEVEQHLAGCDACRRATTDYDELVAALPRALAAASPLSMPESIERRLFETLQANGNAREPAGVARTVSAAEHTPLSRGPRSGLRRRWPGRLGVRHPPAP